ncbi:CHAT domain-containing protein [Marivirga sp. S37H4]|uniref:CHAT domain-containing protein n=1 Tax=Marivirga aurantiaca TaxID=2802615 RepID=A0A935C8E4_9BACT|nr:CHAT domain-containing tetratricopeptide repeat protein [Marivirga aurantiaca]MBK6263653.1 CHAT domain-containing protein [Marivirga aurantiaca]
MIRSFFIFLFLTTSMGAFSQSLTDSIYNDLDTFIANKPNENSLHALGERALHYTSRVEEKEEKLALVILQCNLAYYHKSFDHHTEAINLYENAYRNYSGNQLIGYDIIEYCLKPLGNLYTIRGDFTNAENTIKQYIFMAGKQGDEPQKIAGIINLSVVYHNTGNYDLAIKILKEAIKNPEIGTEQKNLLENNLTANLIALHKIEEAQKTLSLGQEENNSVEDYKNAAQMAFREQDFDQALHYLEKAGSKLIKSPDFTARQIAKIYVEQSDVYLASEQFQKADSILRAALAILIPVFDGKKGPVEEELYPENTLLDIFDGLAYLATDWQEALKYYDLSFYVSHLLQQPINTQEARIINQRENRKRSEKCIELLYQHYQITGETEILKKAFDYAESSKAVVLKEALNRKSLLKQYPKDSLLIAEKELASKQETTIDLLVRSQLTNSSEETIQAIITELNRINFSLKKVRRSISQKYTEDKIPRFTIEQIQEKLKNEKAGMSFYFYGQDAIYQFIITESLADLKQIPFDNDLKISIQNFIAFFDTPSAINNNINSYKTTAFELYRKLQLDQLNEVENLLIIPDGVLGFIPFEALLTHKTRTNIYKEMPFLMKHSKMFYNTSAAFYMNAQVREKGEKVLGIFPVFEGRKRMLKYSLDEAELMRANPKAQIFVREEATKANFLKQLGQNDILHLSTHASGGNFVVPANIEFIDDVMLVHELYGLSIDPYLVVLSACETGVGKLQKGEGAMSIARAFQYAGVQNLLFSLWQVNDYSTARLMQEFYQSYDKTHSAFVANQQSKWHYLENEEISNPKKSPYYWSAFVYYGVPETVESGNGYFYIIIISTLLSILIIAIALKYKKPKG